MSLCVKCGETEAIVGIGSPPIWVCHKCFEKELSNMPTPKQIEDKLLGKDTT